MTDVPMNAGTLSSGAEPSLRRVMGPWLLLLFIVGDILGTGIYALTGQVAKQVGGIVWLPFVVAFVVALVTAFSYLELVTKYPKAAGAALYTQKLLASILSRSSLHLR
jgi:APA family basic amino acid/polyamine antiporter